MAELLDSLDLGKEDYEETVKKLTEDSPVVADVMHRLLTSLPNLNETFYGETVDMRRSHLTVLVLLLREVHDWIRDLFWTVDLDGKVPDADVIDTADDGFKATSGALLAIAQALNTRPERSNSRE